MIQLAWAALTTIATMVLLQPAVLATDPAAAAASDGSVAGDVVAGEVLFSSVHEEQVPPPFRLPEHRFAYQLKSTSADVNGMRVWELRFPSPVRSPVEANNTVHCEYFQPQTAGKHSAVVVLHILGGDFPLSRLFCVSLAQRGCAALFLKMPYYGPRRDPRVDRRMISENPRETLEGMTQAILDIRRAVAWLATREEVDAQQLGIFGISLGGITGALAATVEPRLNQGCFLLAGGNIARVAAESPELERIRRRWAEGGGTREEFLEVLEKIDPVTYGAGARGKRILMLNALEDEVIPRPCTDALWEALGQPEIVWYPGGHYTVIRFLPNALDRVSGFFAAAKEPM